MPDPDSQKNDSRTEVIYRPELARVRKAYPLTDFEVLLELEMAGGRPLGHKPGQFVQLSVFGIGEIPVSICSSPTRPENFELCVRAVGNVTRKINKLAAGEWVGIRGPYGRSFPIDEMHGKDVLIIAGGIGLAPLRSLIHYTFDRREHFRRVILIYGARNPSAILFREEVTRWEDFPHLEMYLTVDQPDKTWRGRVGVVTLPLRDIDIDPETSLVVAAVGPPVMYRYVAMELFRKGIDEDHIYFSLERRFRCGIGKCGHCQLNDLYVCQDGPVFRYSELVGHTEALEVWAPERGRD